MEPIVIAVAGDPKPQPRHRAFARKTNEGKYVARAYDPGTAEGWKSLIADAARKHVHSIRLTGPVRVDIMFVFRRPKSHYRTGKHAGELRPDAPKWHTIKPDRDNLEKAVLDALTQLGFWRDDCQVCTGRLDKIWAPLGCSPGAIIKISQVEE